MEEENKLYVGKLPYAVDDAALTAMFSEVEGVEVVNAVVIMDKIEQRSKGFGFVTVKDKGMVDKAIAALNGKEMNGMNLVVNVARPREERPAGGSGGYRR